MLCWPPAGSQESDSSQTAKKDMLAALRARQDALEDTLKLRLEELKKICIREAELTGKLPKEYPLDPGEEAPTVRRKIGTAFKLDEQKILPKGEVSQSRPSVPSSTSSSQSHPGCVVRAQTAAEENVEDDHFLDSSQAT
ncbi:hypothetical protein CRUP_019721 [Coryphaenoides rupestris]|nr:hypothetical protein CRUP_019721 [Coryphaenoides rupestris]